MKKQKQIATAFVSNPDFKDATPETIKNAKYIVKYLGCHRRFHRRHMEKLRRYTLKGDARKIESEKLIIFFHSVNHRKTLDRMREILDTVEGVSNA